MMREGARSSTTTIVHEPVLTHDMCGQPVHYVHEISIPRGYTCRRKGYQYRYGWVDLAGFKWDVYSKCEPI